MIRIIVFVGFPVWFFILFLNLRRTISCPFGNRCWIHLESLREDRLSFQFGNRCWMHPESLREDRLSCPFGNRFWMYLESMLLRDSCSPSQACRARRVRRIVSELWKELMEFFWLYRFWKQFWECDFMRQWSGNNHDGRQCGNFAAIICSASFTSSISWKL